MKKLLQFCLILLVFACNEDSKIDYVLLNGKIENPKGDNVSILKNRRIVKEIKLQKDGTFVDTLRTDNGFYQLSHGRETSTIYLNQGNDLNITLNTDEFDETISFTGKGAENNNYLASKYLVEEKAGIDFPKIFAMEETDFITEIEKIKTSQKEFLANNKSISSDFKSLQEKNIEYDYLLNIQNYESYHSYYAKKADFKVSDDFKKSLEALDYSIAEDYDTIESYRQLVLGHYINAFEGADNPKTVFETINKEASPKLKKDLANALIRDINPTNTDNEAYYNGIMSISTEDNFKDRLTKKYNVIKKLAKGMPSPEFVDYKNHKGGTTSLKDLKGKYVYVDVWATWCGPCKGEIPYLKEIEKEYHDKNIEFVSTSIDRAKEHDTWVKMVTDQNLAGIQLIADKDWKSQFVKDYAVEGIPRFLLIDPDGNIVTADAPRPSSPKLKELFKELNI